MLLRLLRTYLRPYLKQLAAIVALQTVAQIASLYLPSLNADIIDNGVATGDTGYILHTRRRDAARSPRCRSAAPIAAVYFGARTAMSFGRDLRAAIFHRVGGFSAREVGNSARRR